MELIPNISDIPKWGGGLLTVLAAIIASYKFFIQRPNVELHAELEHDGVVLEEGVVTANPVFHLVNRGTRYAEDVYLEMSLPTWNFGEGQNVSSVNVEVSVKEDNQDEDTEAEVDFFTALHQYLINAIEEDEDQEKEKTRTSELDFEDSILETRHDDMRYFGAPGEINQIIVDDLIYEGAEFRLFSTTVELERFHDYRLEYKIGCRTYGPRTGSIGFEVGYDEIQINHNHPNPWWSRLQDIPSKLLANHESLEVWVSRTELEFHRASFFEILAIPSAEITVGWDCPGDVTVQAKATIYLGEKDRKNIVGTMQFSAYSLTPNDVWETIAPRRKRTNQLKVQTPYRALRQVPLLLSPRYPPYPLDPENQLQIDWSIDYSPTTKGNHSGIKIVDSKLLRSSAGETERVSVEGTIENNNFRERGFFLIVKFYAENGSVISTQYKQMTVSSESQAEFRIPGRLLRSQESRIEDYEFEFIRSL